MKTCFLFNPLTGEFISQYLAQESPEEPGEFLAPIHSTFVEPPAIDAGQVLVFADGEWTLQPDHRGETWYDAQGNPVLIETIGTPDAALSPLLPDAQQLAIAQTQQLALLAAAYAAAIQQPVTYLDTSFQADESSQIVLTKVLVVGAVMDGFFWLDANNAPIPMTIAQLQGLATAMSAQGQMAFAKLQQLKSAVRAAVTVDEVAVVLWQ